MPAQAQQLRSLLKCFANRESIEKTAFNNCLVAVSVEEKYMALQEVRGDGLWNCRTAVHEAVRSGDKPSVEALLDQLTSNQKYEILKVTTSLGHTALHSATARAQTDTVGVLLNNLTQEHQFTLLMAQNNWGNTVLHHAAALGQIDTARVLLSRLTPEHQFTLLKVQDSEGSTALHCAALTGQTDTARYLLIILTPEHQLTLLDMRSNAGRTARDEAIESNYPESGACLQKIRAEAEEATNRVSRELKDQITQLVARQGNTENELKLVREVVDELGVRAEQQDNKIRERDGKVEELEAEKQQALSLSKLRSLTENKAEKKASGEFKKITKWDVNNEHAIIKVTVRNCGLMRLGDAHSWTHTDLHKDSIVRRLEPGTSISFSMQSKDVESPSLEGGASWKLSDRKYLMIFWGVFRTSKNYMITAIVESAAIRREMYTCKDRRDLLKYILEQKIKVKTAYFSSSDQHAISLSDGEFCVIARMGISSHTAADIEIVPKQSTNIFWKLRKIMPNNNKVDEITNITENNDSMFGATESDVRNDSRPTETNKSFSTGVRFLVHLILVVFFPLFIIGYASYPSFVLEFIKMVSSSIAMVASFIVVVLGFIAMVLLSFIEKVSISATILRNLEYLYQKLFGANEPGIRH